MDITISEEQLKQMLEVLYKFTLITFKVPSTLMDECKYCFYTYPFGEMHANPDQHGSKCNYILAQKLICASGLVPCYCSQLSENKKVVTHFSRCVLKYWHPSELDSGEYNGVIPTI